MFDHRRMLPHPPSPRPRDGQNRFSLSLFLYFIQKWRLRRNQPQSRCRPKGEIGGPDEAWQIQT